jgi:hypothetical protein
MHYRLYLMNARSGHIEGVEEFDAPDDGHAINQSFAFAGDRPLELWCGGRKVGRVEARDLTQELLERRRWERAVQQAEQEGQAAQRSAG